MNRFKILKTSWGIAIFYEIEESYNLSNVPQNLLEISPAVYLSLNNITVDEISLKYLVAGIKSIIEYIPTLPVLFSIVKLEYNLCDYQPEGMYYMFRKWFFEKHKLEIEEINVFYDQCLNKYVFPELINM